MSQIIFLPGPGDVRDGVVYGEIPNTTVGTLIVDPTYVYEPPGPLLPTGDARELIAGDGYTADVGRALAYDEPAERWVAGLTVENLSLHARRRLLYANGYEGFVLPCTGTRTLTDGLLRLYFDLPADAGHRDDGPRRPGYYDATVVANVLGGPVTLTREVWVVRPSSRDLPESAA